MQNTTHYNLKKPDYTDFADVFDINDNMDTIDEKLAAPTGDGRDQTVSFTDADLDSGITSFPTFLTKIVSGMKLAKFLRDFKAGMAYVLHVGDLINNATCTESGKALDARMGKTLQDQITSLNDSLSSLIQVTTFTAMTSAVGEFYLTTRDDQILSIENCVPLVGYDSQGHTFSFKRSLSSNNWVVVCIDTRTGELVKSTHIVFYGRYLPFSLQS